MSGIHRFLTRRDRHSRSGRGGSKEDKEESTAALSQPLLRGFFSSQSLPEDKDREKKVKIVEGHMKSIGITTLEERHYNYALHTSKGDIQKAISLLLLLEDSIEGIIRSYTPNVKLLGAENRQGVTCYLDALLFAMFSRLDCFEAILYKSFNDESRQKLVVLLRLWVNMLRSGKLITTDLTKHIQDALSDCGWEDAAMLRQQDASEAFTFITEKLELPLLTLKMDIYHFGKEDASDDHKFINERLLEVAIPPEPTDGSTLTLEDCLEAYFNNKIEVKRHIERRNTLETTRSQSLDSGSISKGLTSHIEEIDTTPTLSPTRTESLEGEKQFVNPWGSFSEFSAKLSSRNLSRRNSIVRERFIPDSTEESPETLGPLATYTPPRKGSFRKEVMMPAWQFFSLIPWYTDNTPRNDAQVAAHFSSKRPILGMCLKRYSFTPQGKATRLDTYIDIPTEIGMPHFIQDDNMGENAPIYGTFKLSLQAMVCHRGNSVDSGHYISIVRGTNPNATPPGSSDGNHECPEAPRHWMRFDDLATERVTLIDIDQALKTESPYLLFYQILPIDQDASMANLPPTAPSSRASNGTLDAETLNAMNLSLPVDEIVDDSAAEDVGSARPSFEVTAPDDTTGSPISSTKRRPSSVAFSEAVAQAVSLPASSPQLMPSDVETNRRSFPFTRRSSRVALSTAGSRANSQSSDTRIGQTFQRFAAGRRSKDRLTSDVEAEPDDTAIDFDEAVAPDGGKLGPPIEFKERSEKSMRGRTRDRITKGKNKEKSKSKEKSVKPERDNLTEPADSLPIFDVQRVQLQFPIAADFVAAQVANNVLVLALSTGRILRIDLDTPEDIDDIDLPKKSSEVGLIQRMFLDPSASHLIITTTLGENYYLHTQSRQPKALSRLKGVSIESIAWNPSLPTASTREILLGTTDGNIYETYIEPSTEFYRREEKYVTAVYKLPDASPVIGISAEPVPSNPEQRRVILATHGKLVHFLGRAGASKPGRDSGTSIYADLFQRETPLTHEIQKPSASVPSLLAISPSGTGGHQADVFTEKEFAWLNSQGIYHGQLASNTPFDSATMLSRSKFPATESARGGKKLIQDPITSMTLSQWHVLALAEGRVVAVNRLNNEVVYDQAVLEPRQIVLGLLTDLTQNTYWLFTNKEIFEVVANDEDRDVWKVLLKEQKFEEALQYARGLTQRDAVLTASGDYLAKEGRFFEAAKVWGKSSKGFEEVCLTMIDNKEYDALRKYLLSQLSTYKKASIMQRMMVATWLVEIFMSKLNSLDDNIATKAELTEGVTTGEIEVELDIIQSEFQEFLNRHKTDLDKRTVYDIISSHGRERELLFFATISNDLNYVLSYWIQREKWTDALNVLQRQSEPDVFYKYSSVLMTHAATGLIEILMRQTNLDPERLIPALLNYNKTASVTINQNQAVRYLNFIIVNHPNPAAAVHNTLISIHASSQSASEAGLLTYLQSQPSTPPPYDADFALRLCIQHKRVQSCIHIYSAMGQYLQAVELALEHDDIELAAIVADRPEGNDKLRKKLWLLVAEKKIRQPGTGIKSAIEFLRRCELLRIEDLIPFFPDFVVIDDFKDEICTALEDYSRHIDALRHEMDNSAQTAHQIRNEISGLDTRYAIVEPGEKCWICLLPLLSRQFFVFPCQHAFHSDCLGKEVLEGAGGKKRYIRELQAKLSKGDISTSRREEIVKELDVVIAEACILCGDHAIKLIDKPFVNASETENEWSL
ncbi:hypothetical protein N7495_001128 [Penicillium taxi]|uniref:uncharacterized protein n=1 Tax=Penicillium taxi TaxID=168475 RepID=UPI002545753F|nr:uncharacterized protein N7495_001128 [Penicillium taxi]KAJ5908446.1 hypothetical protein N7495_001128 [Penicillium taxi]